MAVAAAAAQTATGFICHRLSPPVNAINTILCEFRVNYFAFVYIVLNLLCLLTLFAAFSQPKCQRIGITFNYCLNSCPPPVDRQFYKFDNNLKRFVLCLSCSLFDGDFIFELGKFYILVYNTKSEIKKKNYMEF